MRPCKGCGGQLHGCRTSSDQQAVFLVESKGPEQGATSFLHYLGFPTKHPTRDLVDGVRYLDCDAGTTVYSAYPALQFQPTSPLTADTMALSWSLFSFPRVSLMTLAAFVPRTLGSLTVGKYSCQITISGRSSPNDPTRISTWRLFYKMFISTNSCITGMFVVTC